MTAWTAIGAIAAVAVAGLAIWTALTRRSKTAASSRVFLSMQMSDLTDEQYAELHRQLVHIVRDLRKDYRVEFYNETIEARSEFQEADLDAESYLANISDSDIFVGIITQKIVSSIYLEVGYAIARGKKVVLFVRDPLHPPLLIRKVARIFPYVKLITWDTTESIGPHMRQVLKSLHAVPVLGR